MSAPPNHLEFMTAALSTTFQIVPEPANGLLTAQWAQAVANPDADLRSDYAQLLAEAHRQSNCRFWLLDLRGRNWHAPSFGPWFAHDYARQVARALGGPVFIAYVLAPQHRPIAESEATATTQRAAAAHDLYPYFFDNETDARSWLCDQQELDPAAGSCRAQQ
ncbi:hypothetical protein GCM10023185_22230 [Hymenobacter saemangeumensis]|uniref:STAS/SEC14 domain-containing protein n=1 Tax=Hymenobacter saemangeumensis TaxID=1084522 RepID=A0ABP8IEW3_9BACT